MLNQTDNFLPFFSKVVFVFLNTLIFKTFFHKVTQSLLEFDNRKFNAVLPFQIVTLSLVHSDNRKFNAVLPLQIVMKSLVHFDNRKFYVVFLSKT